MLLGMFCRIPGMPHDYDLMVGLVSLKYVMVGPAPWCHINAETACH